MKKTIDESIERALAREPEFKLNADFKNRTFRAIRKKEKRAQQRLYFWMILGVLGIFGAGIAAMSYFLPEALRTSFKLEGMEGAIPMAVVIGLLVAVFQYLDNRLVKDRFFSH